MKETKAVEILTVLQKYRRVRNHNNHYSIEPYIPAAAALLEKNHPFKMSLSAFHCKSINPDSVLGQTPDGAEEEAIKTLERMCEEIRAVYSPGCELLIVHEGHFYSDIHITPSDKVIDEYERLIHAMTKCPMIQFTNIMSKYHGSDYNKSREQIWGKYMDSLETLEKRVQEDPEMHKRYIAYKAFVYTEFSPVLMQGKTKSEMKKLSRPLAYLWLQRYLVFKKLSAELFSGYFKLSVLSYTSKSPSFGINLIPQGENFGLPWFHALVKKLDGSVELIKKHEAEKRGYELVYSHHRPWYYKERG